MTYREFLEQKVAVAAQSGFHVEPLDVNQILLPHQRDAVCWAVSGGRRGLFESFGLGKTMQQIEIVRLILNKVRAGDGLIVCPLGVRQEFIRDGQKLGVDVKFIRSNKEISKYKPNIYLTNYESIREGKLDPREFAVVSLDEAAILRGFGGTKTFRELMRMFEGSSTYRFVATATPSPNSFIELLSYAAFLGIMEVSEAKTRWFKRNSTQADELTLHEHKKREFWLWVSSWALFLQKPSQLGYPDDGYELPQLGVRWHEIPSDPADAGTERDGQRRLIGDSTISVQNAAREKRKSLKARIAKLIELRAEAPEEHRIIWHDLEAEREAIEAAVPGVASVYGSQDLDRREKIIADFSDGKIQELAAKPVMLGSGCNFQRHCARGIYLGLNFKFADFIQSVHRVHRFLQTRPVRIDLIYTEAEREVRRILEQKWAQHNELVAEMGKIIEEYGLATEAIRSALGQTLEIERREVHGHDWRLVNNDSIVECATMPANSVGLILTSIPFGNQYQYSTNYADLGCNEDSAHFWSNMDYLTPQLLRIVQPGRICAIHVKDRITPGGLTGLGFQTVSPFHAEAIAHYTRHGFAYIGMKTITTDVVRENNQTYRLGWTEQCKDGTKMGCGMPEYLLLFRKPPSDSSDGYADSPVLKEKPLCDDRGIPEPFNSRTNWKRPVPASGYSRARWQIDAHGYARSSGNRLISSEELRSLPHEQLFKLWRDRSLETVYEYEGHVGVTEELDHEERLPAKFMLFQPHSPNPDVWTDITRMRTLNGAQAAKGKEAHLCPLQFDICERVIEQYTMPDEVVFDPFAGLGSVPMMAVSLGRGGIGCELSASYFDDSVYYLRQAEAERDVPTLFDLIGVAE